MAWLALLVHFFDERAAITGHDVGDSLRRGPVFTRHRTELDLRSVRPDLIGSAEVEQQSRDQKNDDEKSGFDVHFSLSDW